ncbi:hypothetical protein B0F90DRAFT_1797979 [Multifurca ochricompacta]|uniref:Uncharacterized protein n=1 Tax=Multifurca ochricompacta TaxID=376703 RepID=A0AAD4LU48_9AGAM|nr:hypothetical protein B0F90DRAFT_1797979 [Multifurca ochricompacta]
MSVYDLLFSSVLVYISQRIDYHAPGTTPEALSGPWKLSVGTPTRTRGPSYGVFKLTSARGHHDAKLVLVIYIDLKGRCTCGTLVL